MLSAQLQAQSPLDPLDPNQFVAQLAQFQSLSELTQIDESMQTLVSDVAPQSASNANGPAAAANSPSLANLNFLTH